MDNKHAVVTVRPESLKKPHGRSELRSRVR